MPDVKLDPLFQACSLFRRRKFQECANVCTEILNQNPYDQAEWSLKTRALTEQVYVDDIEAEEEGLGDSVMDDNTIAQIDQTKPRTNNMAAWSLKTRALTEQVYVDDIEAEEEGLGDSVMDDNTIAQIDQTKPRTNNMAAWSLKTRALTEQVYVDDIEAEEEGLGDSVMDDNTIAQIARPGTSLRTPGTAQGGPSQVIRPVTQSGRPLTGVMRPNTQLRPGTMEQAIRTPRTSQTARPVTSGSSRFIRLGTASILSSPDGPFIDLAHLNIAKYAAQPYLAKALFEYIFYHENNAKIALNLAAQATQASQFKDWWWKIQLGKCYYSLGLFRDAEKQFKSSLKNKEMVETYLRLCKVYVRLDQPVAALDLYKQGLEKFPKDTYLLTGIARIYEGLNDFHLSGKFYKEVLRHDATHLEAIACIATHHFYSDQPEVALRYYRRLLQMGVCNSELFNNLGLCCFYAQQYDLTLACFERALILASENEIAEVWYNVGHTALGIGDINLAYECFRLSLIHNNEHVESLNNLGVIEWKKGHIEQAKSFFVTAASLSPHVFEPHYNYSVIAKKVGDFQCSYTAVQKALEAFPGHSESKELLNQLKIQLAAL